MLASPSRDSKPQTEQTQPLSLSLKPDPLAHLVMMPPPSSLALAESAASKPGALPAASCPNGALDHPPAALPPAAAAASLAQPSTSSLHSHSSLAGTQPQPLSLVTKSLE